MPEHPPKWITPFYYLATIAALCAIVMVYLWHDSGRPDLGGQAVADLTINLGGQPVREHCTTCHVQGGRPDSDHLGQTIRPHPDIAPHRIDQLGCTACHLGEGMALDLEISHGLPGLGARKVLAGEDTQATCFRCHPPGPLQGAEKAWKGYRLFFARACNTCHALSEDVPAGFSGPDLSDIGSVLGLDQLQEAILDPRKDPVNSTMPRFPLSKGQARQISFFLKSLMGTPLYATPMQLQAGRMKLPDVELVPVGQALPRGEALLYQRQCLGCHKFKQVDGRIGPDLSYIGSQRDRNYLETSFDNLVRLIPGSAMPGITMTDADREVLLQFLGKEAIGPFPAKSGKQVYMQLCQRCHAAGGDGQGPIQPNLATYPRRFAGNADFFRSVSDQRLMESLRRGVPGTSMPGYGHLIEQGQLDQVLDLLFTAFIDIARDDKTAMAPLPARPDVLESPLTTDSLYEENCQRCHGAFGSGTGPEAMDYLPRPRNLRNRPYFAGLTDERIARAIHEGVPGTAMPEFKGHLSARDLWSLVAKVRAFSVEQE